MTDHPSATPTDSSSILRISELRGAIGASVRLRGWVVHVRSSGKIAFVVVRDGTGIVQAVLARAEVPEVAWERFATLTQETAVLIAGMVRADARAPGGVELIVRELEVLGSSPLDYPIQPKAHNVDFLMDHRHLWLRSPRQVAALRVRSEIEQAVHDFFYAREFVRIDSPILTAAIGERSGLFSTAYFDEGYAYLAQTGQLYGEAAAAALGRIYTFGPTFRAEKSKTRRHLTEFWMVEPEVAFNDSADNMHLQEELLSAIVRRCLERQREALVELGRDLTRLEAVAPPFPRIDYTDAVTTLQARGHPVQWGDDLGADDESALADGYDRPIFVVNYPKAAKAFYMKENPADPRTVLCNDCLAPEGFGEIIGGSQREDDYAKLVRRIRDEGLPLDSYGWYLDLRKYGTFVHAGFGLGVERTVAYVCGLPHVRETIPFPRMLNRLTP